MSEPMKCYQECEHKKCKGKDHSEDDYEFCQFCQELCLKCEKTRFHKMVNRLT